MARAIIKLHLLEPDLAIASHGGSHMLIHGVEEVGMALRMDGTRTEEEVILAGAGGMVALGALDLLERFRAKGLCSSGNAAMDRYRTFWSDQGASPRDLDRLGVLKVGMLALDGGLSTAVIAAALERSGMRIVTGCPAAVDSMVAVATDPGDLRLEEFVKRAEALAAPWAVVLASGETPAFISPGTNASAPCWLCASFWLRVNRPVEEYLRGRDPAYDFSDPAPGPALRVLAEKLALRMVGTILSLSPHDDGEIVGVDSRTLECSSHGLVRRPQCPACGNPDWMAEQGARPVVLRAIPRSPEAEGGFRRLAPDVAWTAYRHLVSPLCGPVSQLGPMPGRSAPGRPVFVSGYRVRPSGNRIDATSFQKVCAGKGRTPEQARLSALFEAVERFSGISQGDEARVRGSRKDMGPEAIGPQELQLFSDCQLDRWDPSHAGREGALRIAKRCDEQTLIDWTPAWSLTHGMRRYLPFAYCFSGPGVDRTHVCFTGNGTAAGTCLEEAVLQGMLELVERDAVAVWWYNRLERPSVHASLLAAPWVEGLMREYRGLGWDLWVLDLTHDLSIPVYAALARSQADGRYCVGFGCHLDPAIALQRSLSELNQLFDPCGDLMKPWDHRSLPSTTFLHPRGTSAVAPPTAPEPVDLAAPIEDCVSRLRAAGVDVIVVDKSRPDLGVSVAQVVAPGLRHFWPRFAPGRLYSVPVAMGWRADPLREVDLNPVSLLV